MKLTGKARKDFEKWYFKNHVTTTKKFKELYPHEYHEIFDWFYGIKLAFQYGVYVDFFGSVGLILDVQPVLDYDMKKYTKVCYWIYTVFKLEIEDEDYNENEYKTRKEAREQAILNANEIYNDS